MIRIEQLRLPLGKRGKIEEALRELLGLSPAQACPYRLVREALDARRQELFWVYSVDVDLPFDNLTHTSRGSSPRIIASPVSDYTAPPSGETRLQERPLIVGAGPSGLFAALTLAERGYRPIIIERGAPLEERLASVNLLRERGLLDPESNVQFGEGGAGTFSDGKLQTGIRDPRIAVILQTFVSCGAPAEILYQAAPHLGTDRLRLILLALRQKLQQLGVEILFHSLMAKLILKDNHLCRVALASGEELPTEVLLLGTGHSARDTYEMLWRTGVGMQPKAFSLGVRIEQSQQDIDQSSYGRHTGHPELAVASYALVQHLPSGRGVYTFCMCPGGEVIAAASEPGRLVTNGMSQADRSGPNANAALLVGVTPDDYGSHPLDGIAWQRHWEEQAYNLGGRNYCAPLMRVDDFLARKLRHDPAAIQPTYKPGLKMADLHLALPPFVSSSLAEALPLMERKLPGFAPPQALLTAVESRSSSPVRITRNAEGESSLQGLYPMGEGSGYAGGIISAAVDGIKTAEAVISKYRPMLN